MEDNLYDALKDQIWYDIKLICKKFHNKDLNTFKRNILDEFVNKLEKGDRTLGEKILLNCYKNTSYPSGELYNMAILKTILPSHLLEKKTLQEKLGYGNNLIKVLFVNSVRNVVSLYGSSLITGKNQDEIKEYISTETNSYFDSKRKEYGTNTNNVSVVSNIMNTGGFSPLTNSNSNSNDKYYSLKKRIKDLERRLDDLERNKIISSSETDSSSSELESIHDIMKNNSL